MPTVYQRFKEVAKCFPKQPVVYWKKDNHWRHYSYQEFLELIDGLMAGLVQLGISQNDRVAILSENRPEWLMSDLALNKLGAVSVPIHTTANQQFIEHVWRDSDSDWLVVSQGLFQKNERLVKELPGLKKIILISDSLNNESKRLVLFNNLIKAKQENKEAVINNDNLASIIYTSGTTGEAKGVMLSNKNFLSNIVAANQRIKILPTDKFLSFLPLSHVLERTAGSYTPLMNGAAIAYAENVKKLADNIKEVKPTIIISVPKIFEKIYEKIIAGIKQKNYLIKEFFFWSLNQRGGGVGCFLADKLIYSKIRKVFGGNLRLAISGGASIHERILRFFQHMGIQIVEGYGLTETSPIVTVNSLTNSKIGTVGQPLDGVAVKIAEDKEILVKGDLVMQGYWHNQEATQKIISSDGWLKTGDLGFLDKDNFLTIIGRKKEIIVTANGENIMPEKIENIINLSPYIEQSLVVGHRQDFLAALIVPDHSAINKKFSGSISIHAVINRAIDKTNRQLMPYEQIKKFHILDQPFTIEADELTPTLKVRRKIIEAKYKEVIEKIYQG